MFSISITAHIKNISDVIIINGVTDFTKESKIKILQNI